MTLSRGSPVVNLLECVCVFFVFRRGAAGWPRTIKSSPGVCLWEWEQLQAKAKSSYEQAKGRVLFTLGKPEHPLTPLIQPRSRENNLKL